MSDQNRTDQPNQPNQTDQPFQPNQPNQAFSSYQPNQSVQPVSQPTVGSNRRRGQVWKYILAVSISVVLTVVLTSGIWLLVLTGMKMMPWQKEPVETNDNNRLSMSFNFDANTEKALDKLQSVFEIIDGEYFEDLTDAEMLEAMTRGLVNELGNPYTMYLTAKENAQIEESMSGNYSGIGAFVSLNKEGLVEVTEIIEDSPAEAAGLQIGDLFVAVDGTDVSGYKDITSVAVLVRGEEGTSVELELYRPSAGKNIQITATRRKITSASVSHRMLDETIGYVQIREFSQGVSKNFIVAIEDLKAQGAVHLVFDLRNNTGGIASEVIDMLDYLLPKGVIASIEGREGGEPFKSEWGSDKFMGVDESMKYAVLVNNFSASASELFSGCLRDYDKAYLIGEQTFGKGSGTITYTLEDGSAVNVTNFLYYLPDGESIEGEGLAPHLEVVLPDEAQWISINQMTLEQDTQLKAAIDYLTGLR